MAFRRKTVLKLKKAKKKERHIFSDSSVQADDKSVFCLPGFSDITEILNHSYVTQFIKPYN